MRQRPEFPCFYYWHGRWSPAAPNSIDEGRLEEERRLAYVALKAQRE